MTSSQTYRPPSSPSCTAYTQHTNSWHHLRHDVCLLLAEDSWNENYFDERIGQFRLPVCPDVCVSLFAPYRSQFKSTLHQTSHTGRHQSREELIKFWYSPASGAGSRTLLNNSSTLPNRTFFNNFAHISAQTYRIFIKILPQIYPWTRTSSLNVGTHPDPDYEQATHLYFSLHCPLSIHRDTRVL